jgi:hypothetical protein
MGGIYLSLKRKSSRKKDLAPFTFDNMALVEPNAEGARGLFFRRY